MAYSVLLNQLDDEKCDKSGFELNAAERATKAIDDAAKLGVPKFIRPEDILAENEKLNLLFCAEIYYRQTGLKFEPFSDSERDGFAVLITDHHKNDENLQKVLPINPHSKDLFVATANSVLLRFTIDIFIFLILIFIFKLVK